MAVPTLSQVTSNDSEQRVTAAAISPDGRWIAYGDMVGMSLRVLQSGATLPLKGPEGFRAERVAWFPDSLKVLVSRYMVENGNPQIWTVYLTGSLPELFRKEARNGVPSPEGTRVLFTTNRDREIWIVGTGGEGARRLLGDPSGKVLSTFTVPFWSADGRRVDFLRRSDVVGGDYGSVDANTGAVLAIEKNVAFDAACAFKDGRLLFLRDSPLHFRNAYSLWEVTTNEATGAFLGKPRALASFERAKALGLTSTDDGNRLSFVLERGQLHVYVGELEPGSARLRGVERLTYDTLTDYPHAWLHDNQAVIFESNRSGIYRLYSQRLQERTPRELNTGSEQAVLPQVTPDGKWVLYAVNRRLRRQTGTGYSGYR